MPDRARAADAVAGSPLFDEEWYAAQTGATYSSRADAAADYVARAGAGDVTPHPLFEPTWLYPAGRWRREAPDPLSHYLARPDRRTVSTHPLLPRDAEEWVRAAGPDTVLPRTAGRPVTYDVVREAALATLTSTPPGLASAARQPPDPPGAEVSVVIPVGDRFQRPCTWVRSLYRTEIARAGLAAELLVCASDPAHLRLAALVALTLPGTRVVIGDGDAGCRAAGGGVTVLIDPALEPPEWPWLHHLVEALDRAGVGIVAPLLVEPDQTVVAAGTAYDDGRLVPFLRGETPADAARAAHLPVPALLPAVLAFRTVDGPTGPAYVVPDARVVVPSGRQFPAEQPPGSRNWRPFGADLWQAAGFAGPGRPIRVVEGRPALRWAIDVAAPLAPRGRRWGDDPFARSLAVSLEALGQWVTVDHPETRTRASRDHDDVVLVIRGLDPVARSVHDSGTRLLWVISHPEEVTEAECSSYDLVLAASPAWARGRERAWRREIRPVLQCTDTRRFRPGLAEPDSGPEFLFVGNSRGELRPVVREALAAGLDLTLYGDGWDGLVDGSRLSGRNVPNDQLGALYASAGLVLNDHWTDMREQGFVSNRIFDALACGARVLSDDVAGLREVVGAAVPVWSGPADLRRLAEADWRRHFPDAASRHRTAELVVAEHSFDARAAQLLEAALSVVRP